MLRVVLYGHGSWFDSCYAIQSLITEIKQSLSEDTIQDSSHPHDIDIYDLCKYYSIHAWISQVGLSMTFSNQRV